MLDKKLAENPCNKKIESLKSTYSLQANNKNSLAKHIQGARIFAFPFDKSKITNISDGQNISNKKTMEIDEQNFGALLIYKKQTQKFLTKVKKAKESGEININDIQNLVFEIQTSISNIFDCKTNEFSLLISQISQVKEAKESGEKNINDIQDLVLEIQNSISKICNYETNEFGLPISQLEFEVNNMVERGKKGLAPETPYFKSTYETIEEWLLKTYGKYLSASGETEEDFLYIDQLGAIHPLTEEKTKLKSKIKKLKSVKSDLNKKEIAELQYRLDELNSKEYHRVYGDDVKLAIINFFRKKERSYQSLIKTKSTRLEKIKSRLLNKSSISNHIKNSSRAVSAYNYLTRR